MAEMTRPTAGGRRSKGDAKLGIVHLWSATGKFPTVLKELIDTRLRVEFHQDQLGDPPMIADYLVSVTMLTPAFERQAARQNAMPVVLPEGGAWLRMKISETTALPRDLHLRIYRNETR